MPTEHNALIYNNNKYTDDFFLKKKIRKYGRAKKFIEKLYRSLPDDWAPEEPDKLE